MVRTKSEKERRFVVLRRDHGRQSTIEDPPRSLSPPERGFFTKYRSVSKYPRLDEEEDRESRRYRGKTARRISKGKVELED